MTSLLRSAVRALQGAAATEGRTVGAQGRIDRAAGSVLARPFSNSPPSAAAAKGKSAAKKPQVKKKAVLRKNAPSGPRSTSVRRKTDGASQSTSSLSKGSPFLRETSDSLTQADEVSLRQLDTTELGSIVKLPESFVKIASGTELSQLRGNGKNRAGASGIVIRRAQVDALAALKASFAAEDGDSTRALLLVGQNGSGKSTTSRLVAGAAHREGAILIHVPQALAFLDSSASYTYSEQLGSYLQPTLLLAFAKDLLQLNRTALTEIRAPSNPTGSEGETVASTLERACGTAITPSERQLLVESCVRTLASQTQRPVAVIIDEAEALFSPTLYRDADFQVLQSYDFALPRMLLNLVLATQAAESSIKWPIDRGMAVRRGMVLCSTTCTQTRFSAARRALENPMAVGILDYGNQDGAQKQHLLHVRSCDFKSLACDGDLTLREAASLYSLVRHVPAMSPRGDEDFLSKLVEGGSSPKAFLAGLQRSLM